MVLLDDRAGSKTLAPYLTRAQVPFALDRLDFGDLCLIGHGPDGTLVRVGVEVKTLPDLLTCLTTGRYAQHQLPGMREMYDVQWLVVEGEWRADPHSGVLQTKQKGLYGALVKTSTPRRGGRGVWTDYHLGTRRFMAREVETFLLSISQQGGVRVQRTTGKGDTAAWVAVLWKWWSKPWADHRSLVGFQTTTDLPGPTVVITPHSLVRRVAKELPGVGWLKSHAVDARFGSVQELALADEREWREIEGVGKTLAGRIVRALQGSGGD